MAIKTDWHIHKKYSCDSACMEIEDLVKGAIEQKLKHYKIDSSKFFCL